MTIDNMVDRLAAHHFLAVTGISGSGKSSLVRITGTVGCLGPRLVGGSRRTHFYVVDFRPGQRPLFAMAVALLDATNVPRTDQDIMVTETVLARGPHGLLDWWAGAGLPSEANLLVLADQFEEIFRFRQGRAGDDIDAFVALLLGKREREGAGEFYVVITMRSDFLGECAQFAGFSEIINDAQFLTPRLTREQRREAIEGPAGVYGGEVEPRLVNRLLNDTETGADQLPLMQHALMRLWRIAKARAGDGAPVMTLADYESLGGIGATSRRAPVRRRSSGASDFEIQPGYGALSGHADEILAEFTDDQRRLAMHCCLPRAHGERGGGRP